MTQKITRFSTVRMDIFLSSQRKGLVLCLLLLAFTHEVKGQRRKNTGRKNYRLQNEEGQGNYDQNSLMVKNPHSVTKHLKSQI